MVIEKERKRTKDRYNEKKTKEGEVMMNKDAGWNGEKNERLSTVNSQKGDKLG